MTTNRSDLFAGQDWTAIYRAFTSINFRVSDPASINRALREYLRVNFPEDFNDYLASSEFIAILDLLSWLAGTLAYKTDIAARENFLETAESRESILRLARFLSYNPSRSRPAQGILKLVEIETTEDVRDALGRSLANTPVQWDDADDPEWFERFVAVLNAAMLPTNPFGTPLKQGQVGGARAALYRLNGAADGGDLTFSADVGGLRTAFEVVNGDFDGDGGLFQRAPDPGAALHIYNLSDGSGNGSPRTGFFAFFKQGASQRRTFQIDTPIENQLLPLDSDNITQDDMWVQTVADDGSVLANWQRVPAVFSENITFNSLPLGQRDIYAAITGDDDRVTLRFSDGRFGSAPVGLIRVTYRVGNGLSYTVRAAEIERVRLSLPYIDRADVTRRLTLTFSLAETVSNASARETDEEIRRRAPRVYATQGRMVSGEDYNSFPLLANIATRIKALNRVYSGQSRHVDRHDPTGTYSDVSVFGDDGILFREPYGLYAEVPSLLNRTPEQLVELHILPMLRASETALRARARLFESLPARAEAGGLPGGLPGGVVPQAAQRLPVGAARIWNHVTSSPSSATGWFGGGNSPLLRPGASLRFRPPGAPADGRRDIWTALSDVTNPDRIAEPPLPSEFGAGEIGPVTLSEPVPQGSVLVDLIPRFAPEIQPGLLTGDFGLLARLDANQDVALWYDWTRDTGAMWGEGTDAAPDPRHAMSPAAIRVLRMPYRSHGEGGGVWQMFAEGLRHVFESERRCEFYTGGRRAVDARTGEQREDTIRVLQINPDLHTARADDPARLLPLDRDWPFALRDLYLYPNGDPEPRRVVVRLADEDEDGVPDRPDAFDLLVAPTTFSPPDGGPRAARPAPEANRLLFWRRDGRLRETPMPQTPDPLDPNGRSVVIAASVADLHASVAPADRRAVVGYVPPPSPAPGDDGTGGVFYVWNPILTTGAGGPEGWIASDDHVVRLGRGANVAARHVGLPEGEHPSPAPLSYNWRHYAAMDSRVDPAATNIHDIFVLGAAYDAAVRDWIARGAPPAEQPDPPSELDLRLAFREMEQFRMFSDQIVWRPVRYKPLFGPGSVPELRAQFKVVRLAGSALTDGEIRSRVVRAVDDYFSASRWDFGETFYYTELAAFLHQRLAGVIGSVVLVPTASGGVFGDGFEVTARADEMFVSTAQIADVVLIGSNTPTALRSAARRP